jgi:hypothetical protein
MPSFSIRDLSSAASQVGRFFSSYVNQALEINSLDIDVNGDQQTDTTVFGDIVGQLLESFITGQALHGNEHGTLQSVHIVGVRPMRPVGNIKLKLSNYGETANARSIKKRNSEVAFADPCQRADKKPKIAKSKKDVASLDTADIEHQLGLIQMSDGFVNYTPYHYIQIPSKNLQLRLQHGARFVSVKNLVRLLAAQPWRSLVVDALPFRIIQERGSPSPRVRSFVAAVQESIVAYAMARWEKQFWIELPSNLEEAYPDEIDRQFIEQYKASRTLRKSRLFANANKIVSKLDCLIEANLLPPAARHDLGLPQYPRNHVPWMPTRENLLHDMAIRAGRDPCRLYFVFNKFAHSFYEQKYHLAFPPLLDGPSALEPEPLLQKNFFGDELLTKYWPNQSYDDISTDAMAEWYLYRDQLIVQTQEPALTQPFPREDEFAKLNPLTLQNCRCAYFDKSTNAMLDTPRHPDNASIGFRINKSISATDIWQDQPVPNIRVEEYIQLTPFDDPILTSILPPPIIASDLLSDDTDIDSILAEDDSWSTMSAMSECSD